MDSTDRAEPDYAGRMAEISAVEEEYRGRNVARGIEHDGHSVWDSPEGLRRLREIDRKYGIREGDPGVYSIAAYQAAIGDLRAAYETFAESSADSTEADLSQSFGYQDKKANIGARHFPRDGVETLPKLWRRIKAHLDHCLHHAPSYPVASSGPAGGYDGRLFALYVQGVCRRLSDLGGAALLSSIEWAQKAEMKPDEAINVLMLISARIEAAEAAGLEAAATDASRSAAPPKPRVPRIEVLTGPKGPSVRVDSKESLLDDPEALLLGTLLKADGEYCSYNSLKSNLLLASHPERTMKKLNAKLARLHNAPIAIIETDNKGSRIARHWLGR